ncbi:MAG: hypothetical protein COA90_00795 [Gammaproteobacteria bacterium]|nr:MAG: hypothetical protein COA90_00795 [Gammaproteobacteria bacterium]
MKGLIKWLFIDSHVKWLCIILLFEYWVAVTISPTLLTDFSLANDFVEVMSFIPTVHAFDDLAIHPEATRFFIALSFFLLLAKSMAIYVFFLNNPNTEMSQFVITPYTKTKPNRNFKLSGVLTEEEAKQLSTVKRSMFSRIVWSILSLGLAAGFIFMSLNVGSVSERDLRVTQGVHQSLIQGGFSMWLSFSLYRLTIAAGAITVAFFIIKDYLRLFIEITKKCLVFILSLGVK